MKLKTRLTNIFKQRVLKPQLKKMDAWEASVINRPGTLQGGENSPVRFNIPREGLEMEGDHPPLPGFQALRRRWLVALSTSANLSGTSISTLKTEKTNCPQNIG